MQHRLIDQSKLLLTETVVEESSMELEETDAEPVEVPAEQASSTTCRREISRRINPGRASSSSWLKQRRRTRPFTPGCFRGHFLCGNQSRLSRGIPCCRLCPVMWWN